MRFFKKTETKEADKPIEGWVVANAPTPPPVVAVPVPAEVVATEPESVDDAKQRIADLKLEKKELQAEKKDVQTELADVRASHSETRAGRYVMPRGGGTMGRMMRSGIQNKRRGERMSMQAEIQAYNDAKAKIDADILAVDREILRLDKYVKANAPAGPTRTAAAKPAPVSDITERLRALTDLKDAGLISDDEYNAKKTDLLARL